MKHFHGTTWYWALFISSVAASNVLPYLLKTPFTKNWFQPEPPPPHFTPAYVWWDEIYFLPLCFHGNVDERRAGEEVGGLLQPPKSEPSVWTIHKTVEINPSWGRFNKSLPVSPSDEHRGRGGGGAQKVGGGTKMWKNNQRHTPIGRHEGKVAFLEHLPLIFIPERHNWFLMRCLLSEVLLILPDSHLWVLRRRQTKRHTNLRLPGVSQ